jgi:hypothetical protein
MAKRDWHRECLAICQGLCIPLRVWDPIHASWGATCADRMKYTPEEYVLSLTSQAAEGLHWHLHLERTAIQAADLDPELGKVTPQIDMTQLHRRAPDEEG